MKKRPKQRLVPVPDEPSQGLGTAGVVAHKLLPNIQAVSIGDWFRSLTPAQMWKLMGAVATVMTLSFGAGRGWERFFYISDTVEVIDLARQDVFATSQQLQEGIRSREAVRAFEDFLRF